MSGPRVATALKNRKIAELEERNAVLWNALEGLLELVESDAPDGYYTEHPAIPAARAALDRIPEEKPPHE